MQAREDVPASGVALITGSSRGIGLEFATQFLKLGMLVLATCRNPMDAWRLQALRQQAPNAHNLRIYQLDVRYLDSITNASGAIQADNITSIDYLINNAGVATHTHPYDPPFNTSRSEVMRVFETNAAGALSVTQTFLPMVRASTHKKVMFLSSTLASIGDDRSGGYMAYRMSKAALNMAVRNLAVDPTTQGVTYIAVHPGWVQTDMGNSGGLKGTYTAEQSVNNMLNNVLFKKTAADSGRFFNFTGEPKLW